MSRPNTRPQRKASSTSAASGLKACATADGSPLNGDGLRVVKTRSPHTWSFKSKPGLGVRRHRHPQRVATARHDDVVPVQVERRARVRREDSGLRVEARALRAQHVGLEAPRLELANHRARHLLAQVPPFHYESNPWCHMAPWGGKFCTSRRRFERNPATM